FSLSLATTQPIAATIIVPAASTTAFTTVGQLASLIEGLLPSSLAGLVYVFPVQDAANHTQLQFVSTSALTITAGASSLNLAISTSKSVNANQSLDDLAADINLALAKAQLDASVKAVAVSRNITFWPKGGSPSIAISNTPDASATNPIFATLGFVNNQSNQS